MLPVLNHQTHFGNLPPHRLSSVSIRVQVVEEFFYAVNVFSNDVIITFVAPLFLTALSNLFFSSGFVFGILNTIGFSCVYAMFLFV